MKIESKFLISLAFSCVNITAYAFEENLCEPGEVMIASCQLDEKKHRTISFCSGADKEVVIYRIGGNSVIELEVDFSSKKPLSRWVDKGTYTTYFGFRSFSYAYVFGVPQEVLGARAFLEVAKENETVMSRVCTNNSFGTKYISSKAIRDVADDEVENNGFLFPP